MEIFNGDELNRARRWYATQHGTLQEGQDLMLVCVFDPTNGAPESRTMHYRPNEIFEIEHPWLSSPYGGPAFAIYFGTWYGSGLLKESQIMDFERFYDVGPGSSPLPKWGVSWR
jgi:hypothetical protein